MATIHHQIVIVGGGCAGITVAASLQRHRHELDLDIAIIEPAREHYYQPAFTLVGAGTYDLEATRRDEAALIPEDVTWIEDKASAFAPESNTLTLASGRTLTYDHLVVCPGLGVRMQQRCFAAAPSFTKRFQRLLWSLFGRLFQLEQLDN